MKKLKGIIIGILLFGAIVGGIIYWQANQKVTDPADTESTGTYRMDQIMQLDEASLQELNGKTVSVTGFVLANEGDELERTITMGVNELESVVCQIDNRHLAKFAKLGKGNFIGIKGILSGHDFDEMLGKTIQMKNCTTAKLK